MNAPANNRILSLDVFRGITMALMVLVNSISGIGNSYPILMHASWHGCTLADLVFPSFLFIVGITLVVSLKKYINNTEKASGSVYMNIMQRTLLLFLLGIFLNIFPNAIDLSHLRFYGILQRIAFCYFVCAMLYLNTTIKTQGLIFLGLLIGYWFLLVEIPVPYSTSIDQLTMNNNWVGFIDRMVFSQAHLYKNFDPEGLLSTLPAIATTLSGVLAGVVLISQRSKQKICFSLIVLGILFLALASLWDLSVPINKNLWTSSFVLWTSGISLCVFGLCYFIIDILGVTLWAVPFKIFGMNALFIFIFHVILLKMQFMFFIKNTSGTKEYLGVVLAKYLFNGYSQANISLFYGLLFLFLNFLVAALLYRRKIFFKL